MVLQHFYFLLLSVYVSFCPCPFSSSNNHFLLSQPLSPPLHFYPSTMSLYQSSHLSAILFSVKRFFFSSSPPFSLTLFFFSEGHHIHLLQGSSVEMSQLSDIWVITMKYAEPMNTLAGTTVVNLISFLLILNPPEFPLISLVRCMKVPREGSSGLCWTGSQTPPLLTLIHSDPWLDFLEHPLFWLGRFLSNLITTTFLI